MNNLTIKMKLIIIFILIKIIPLLLLSYLAYISIHKINQYFYESTKRIYNQTEKTINETANQSINDSIKNLDKKSQLALERISYEIANNVAEFLQQRDNDILFLSKLELNQKILENFYTSKNKDIIAHGEYYFDDKKEVWLEEQVKSVQKISTDSSKVKKIILKDNEKEFNYTNPKDLKTMSIPLYKEVSYFDLNGIEKFKISKINSILTDVSQKKNTYINSENYFEEISLLKKGEIYVSNVIGEYVPSRVIGNFSRKNAKKMGIEFEPKNHAYAGKENPVGKKFEGIIRFITPVFENNEKIGFLSLALDHEHIMQYTDTSNPTSPQAKQDIADASNGNYAFMWDNLGRNISHARDYFIVGYDKNTGNPTTPWLSEDIVNKQEKSNKNMNKFLEEYPKFEKQSLDKKPNMKQLKENGKVGLDCRYLNFAPQCHGWMQITEDGGYGSFIINWSNVWKLTTAATIPYYTGQYGNTKRGFGFITIGANVDEFHLAANKTKESVNEILTIQTDYIKEVVLDNKTEIDYFIDNLINELTVVTFVMVFLIILVALYMSNYISNKIERLLIGTNKFSNNELDYRIDISSDDEIGELEKSFNTMASKIKFLLDEEKKINSTLEERVIEGIEKQIKQEELIIQQSKLASMGEMIGNIAHQWRQPLHGLHLIIQNILFFHNLNQLDDTYLEKSVKKADLLIHNMSNTIDDFRNFFIPNKEKVIFSVDDSLEKTISLMDSSFKHSQINILINSHDNDILIEGYPNEFSQVLVNILNNAKDVLIKRKIENAQVSISLYKKDLFAILEIKDNAKGIPENILNKIFEPYFTTKHQSQGTGIGLYMSKNIIENNMDGVLSVRNSIDGAVFTITMPIKDAVS